MEPLMFTMHITDNLRTMYDKLIKTLVTYLTNPSHFQQILLRCVRFMGGGGGGMTSFYPLFPLSVLWIHVRRLCILFQEKSTKREHLGEGGKKEKL